LFAHVGWLFRRRQASADVARLSDLWALPSVRLQHRYYALIAVAVGLLLPALIAAVWGDFWGGLLVAGFLRAAILLQATFCVNSLAHLLGSKRYDARGSARDSVITALVTFGEGYHNFHHRFPFDYRNGVRWWQFDPSKWLIWSMARVGLADGLRIASPATVAKAASARAGWNRLLCHGQITQPSANSPSSSGPPRWLHRAPMPCQPPGPSCSASTSTRPTST
jgi:fatty-acid desaturase